jgi:hypothetical protein
MAEQEQDGTHPRHDLRKLAKASTEIALAKEWLACLAEQDGEMEKAQDLRDRAEFSTDDAAFFNAVADQVKPNKSAGE